MLNLLHLCLFPDKSELDDDDVSVCIGHRSEKMPGLSQVYTFPIHKYYKD